MPTTLPLNYELTIYSGATYLRMFRWLPDGQTPQDFTGWAGFLRIGNGKVPVVERTLELSDAGLITVELTPAVTYMTKPGTYAYNVDLMDPDDRIIRFLRGRAEFIRDVAEPALVPPVVVP